MGTHDETPAWLAELLDEHGSALVLYARRHCDCPEDVVQDALLKLVSLPRRPEPVLPWLYKVVRNGAISALRRQRRRIAREQRAATSVAWFESVEGTLDAEVATAALADLPVELGEVVIARIWGQLTFAEIGELAGSSTATAQRRYQHAISKLQLRLERSCETPNDCPAS